ncbi:Elongation factor 1-alpha C [Apostasia shenzhenica]|uniref:Elongation factor 1-alpha C n=1 Tax=Apostasia shenzhenica TaxID=1088818 RepID=A0A2I0ABU3_9ASPA|nr:Elongation factor 1-alpha C [Apostasia shenzhenica]
MSWESVYTSGYDEDCEPHANNADYKAGHFASEGVFSEQNKSEGEHGQWHCSVCTYVNDESSLSCYLCGVHPGSFNDREIKGEREVPGLHKHSASVMAKSLFSGRLRMKGASILKNIFPRNEANRYHEIGAKVTFKTLRETFTASNTKHSLNIVPFRFDTLSPDDIVSLGKNCSRIVPKDESVLEVHHWASSSHIDKELDKILSNTDEPETSYSTLFTHVVDSQNCGPSTCDDESQSLAGNLHHLKLDKRVKNNKSISSPAHYKPEKWLLSEHEQETTSQLSIAIVGHVDSGKSTLSGRLLHLLGRISQKEIHKYQKEAKEKGKGSFAYAWAMDDTPEERERGITMTVAVAYFESKKYRVVLLDSPGHKDFVPNMISGATLADAAILVVDASVGSFESGMGVHVAGQTKEHAQLIRSFGIEQIIVAVNKMDAVQYSKERFDFVRNQLGSFLRSCGFKDMFVKWVPLSAIDNENLVTSSSDVHFSWYSGLCLLDSIDSLQPPERQVFKPLLLPICDVVSSHSLGPVAASGKVEAGAIRQGSKVIVMPSGDFATVRSIERDSHACSSASAGDHVAVSLQGMDGANLVPGGVLCHPDFPVTVASDLELRILVLDIKMPILIGSHVEFHIRHAKVAARVAKIVSLLDQKKGKTSKSTPRLLIARQSAVIQVSLERPVCVAEFSGCRALGRAFLRASGITIAAG